MDSLVQLIYVEGDPLLTAVKLLIVMMFLELFAVVCSYIGGVR